MNRRITILCDNTVGPVSGTLGEHGFAALVEWEGDALLFDTGMGETLLRNAQRLGRNLAAVFRVVISPTTPAASGLSCAPAGARRCWLTPISSPPATG